MSNIKGFRSKVIFKNKVKTGINQFVSKKNTRTYSTDNYIAKATLSIKI